MKTNSRKSSFKNVAKNIESMISIDLSVGLDFEVKKEVSGKVSYLPHVGTKVVTFNDLLENPTNVLGLAHKQVASNKEISKIIKYQPEDFEYAVIVFKLLKQKISDPLDCVRSIQFARSDNGFKTLKFELHNGLELSFLVDDAAADSIVTM